VAEVAANQRTALVQGNEENVGDWAQVMVAFERLLMKFLVMRKSTNKMNFRIIFTNFTNSLIGHEV